MTVTFDYDALKDAQSYMSKLDGYYDELKSYGRDLKSSINNSLNEAFLAGNDPYGCGYVESAKRAIDRKNTLLENDADAWSTRATNLGNFVDYVEARDKQVASDLSMLMYEYVDFSLLGLASFAHDSIVNFFTIDLANSCEVTREIMEWVKALDDDLDAAFQDLEDWFQHGEGKYWLNMIGAVVGAAAALAGAIAGIVAAPFTGGASVAATIACIGAIAGAVAAVMTTINAGFSVVQNWKAKDIEQENPAEARFYGNIDGVNEYIKRTDLGDADDNEFWGNVGAGYDAVHATAEVVSTAANIVSFGTKNVVKDGKNTVKFDISKDNVLKNVKKAIGINVEKVDGPVKVNEGTIKAVGIGDGTAEISLYKGQIDEVSAGFTKVTSDNSIKFTLEKMASHSEYQGVTLSNGFVSATQVEYVTMSKNSSISIDIGMSNTAAKINSDMATQNLTKWFGAERGLEIQDKLYDIVKDTKDITDKISLGIDLMKEDGNDDALEIYSKFTDTKVGGFITDYIVDVNFEEGEYSRDHLDFGSKWTGVVENIGTIGNAIDTIWGEKSA